MVSGGLSKGRKVRAPREEITWTCCFFIHAATPNNDVIRHPADRYAAKRRELRAATCLGRLLHGQGKSIKARDLLMPTCRWFAEGFDSRDLKDAKALLAELTA